MNPHAASPGHEWDLGLTTQAYQISPFSSYTVAWPVLVTRARTRASSLSSRTMYVSSRSFVLTMSVARRPDG